MPLITHTHYHYHGGDHSTPIPVFDAVTHKMLETIMAQLDDLQNTDAGIQSDLDQIKTYLVSQNDKLTALTDQLTKLQQTTPPQVDLQPAIDAAQAIKDEADQIVATFNPPATVEPAPATSTDPTAGSASSDSSSTDTSGSPATDTPTPDVQP